MLTYSLEERGKLPVYEFLYRSIREDILAGKLHAGEKLPPKRVFAEHLGVSVVTVENAYAQLLLEGYLEAKERRGYFVCALEGGPMRSAAPSVVPLAEEPQSTDWFADFKTNRPLPERFPFSVWARLMREVLTERDPALLSPMPGQGLFCLREAIAAYLDRFRGMTVSPAQIVVGAGTEFLYGLAVQLLGREKLYAVEDPGYGRVSQAIAAHGARCVPVPLDAQGLSVGALFESGAQAAHLSPAHHFPTGRVTPAARRRELLAWAQDGRFLIEDDYDSEFRFFGKPMPTLQSIDRGGRVLYMNTFSKTMTPAIRISFLVLPEALARRFAAHPAACTVSSFEQMTLAKFISGGYFESHLARSRNFYRRQRDHLISAIRESPLGKNSVIREADAGLHFLLQVKSSCSDPELVRRAAAQGVNISCLSEYYSDPAHAPKGCFVVNFTGVKPEQMGEAANRLSRAVLGESDG